MEKLTKNFFLNTPLYEIQQTLTRQIKDLKSTETVEFTILNPDIQSATYNGNIIQLDTQHAGIYRGYKTWLDLAHTLRCKMLTPLLIDEHLVKIRYQKLHKDTFHDLDADKEEKYGQGSIFSQIHKNEEFSFLHFFSQALRNVKLETRRRILNLGVNNGDEFELLQKTATNFKDLELVGIDYCSSAIEEAKTKFQHAENVSFYTHDINDLASLDIGKFDLIISIGTLQSSNLEFHKLFMSIIQNQLKKEGAVILGFPNCRWVDGEMIYGAKMKNYPFSEMSNLYKDVVFCKKYLQQKKFRVTVTGKDYIFLTATSIR